MRDSSVDASVPRWTRFPLSHPFARSGPPSRLGQPSRGAVPVREGAGSRKAIGTNVIETVQLSSYMRARDPRARPATRRSGVADPDTAAATKFRRVPGVCGIRLEISQIIFFAVVTRTMSKFADAVVFRTVLTPTPASLSERR